MNEVGERSRLIGPLNNMQDPCVSLFGWATDKRRAHLHGPGQCVWLWRPRVAPTRCLICKFPQINIVGHGKIKQEQCHNRNGPCHLPHVLNKKFCSFPCSITPSRSLTTTFHRQMPPQQGPNRAKTAELKSQLPPWDRKASKTTRAKRLIGYKYHGLEPMPKKHGWIRDFVTTLDGERTEDASICVPEQYWVALSMLNWGITVQQHVMHLMGSLKTTYEEEACDLMQQACYQRLWWYLRCRDSIRLQVKKGDELVSGLHEFVWREAEGIEDEITQLQAARGTQAQLMSIEMVCTPREGWPVGECSLLKFDGSLLMIQQSQAGLKTTTLWPRSGLRPCGHSRRLLFSRTRYHPGGKARMIASAWPSPRIRRLLTCGLCQIRQKQQRRNWWHENLTWPRSQPRGRDRAVCEPPRQTLCQGQRARVVNATNSSEAY